MKNALALLLFSFIAFTACKKESSLGKSPVINLAGVSSDSIISGDYLDTVYIQFSLSDGDADLGYEQDQSQNYDIYVRDARADTFTGYFFPVLDKNITSPANKKGLQGTAYFILLGSFTFTREDSLHTATGDTTQYEIYIKDKAGNQSNHITTGNIYIKPV